MAPWAGALYACDERWWRLRGPSEAEFTGLRYIGKGFWSGCTPCGVDAAWSEMQWCGRKIGAGGNSGFQAVNLAAVAGAKRIVLLGFDMRHTGGRMHHHVDHGAGLTNPETHMLQGCANRLDAAAQGLEARGVEVINCTRDTALTAYRRAEIRDVI